MKEKLLTSRECHYAIDYLSYLGYEDKEKMLIIGYMEDRVRFFGNADTFGKIKNYGKIKEFNKVIRQELNNVAGNLHQEYSLDCKERGDNAPTLKELAIVGKSYFADDMSKISDKDIDDRTR